VLAHHPADPAAQRQAADANAGRVAGGERPAIRIERCGHPAPGRAAADAHEPAAGVEDVHVVKMRQVDHHPANVAAVAERAVLARAHCHRQVVTYGASECGGDLVRVTRPDHHRWTAGAVEHPRRGVVPVVPGSPDLDSRVCRRQTHRSASSVVT
jgi:hypothetical protein